MNLELIAELKNAAANMKPSAKYVNSLTTWKETAEALETGNIILPPFDLPAISGLVPMDQAPAIIFFEEVIKPSVFIVRSVLVVQIHMVLAYYSRKLNCNPDIPAVLAVCNDTVSKEIEDRKAASTVTFDSPVLWTHLKSDEYIKAANDDVRKELFLGWWSEIYPTVELSIGERIFVAYKLLKRYQQMERPNSSTPFEKNSSSDIQAAICGFFRRASQGRMYAPSYSYDDCPNRLADMLVSVREKVEKKLTGNDSTLTPFGKNLMVTLDLHIQRNRIVDARHNAKETGVKVKSPLASMTSKRGRARLGK